jgi:hypothetical protein
MKPFVFFVIIFVAAFSSFAELTIEDVSPHLPTNTPTGAIHYF